MEEKINKGYSPQQAVPVGGVVLASKDLEYNKGRKTVSMKVKNCGDRPVQVGSHFHFFEVNRYLQFDRESAYGYHLNIPATTAVLPRPEKNAKSGMVKHMIAPEGIRPFT